MIPPDFGVPESALVQVDVPTNLREARWPERDIMAALDRFGYGDDAKFGIKLAFEEAVTNAVKHGNSNDEAKRITISYYVDEQRIVLMVRDQGPGFSPDQVPDPTAEENLERPSGRGIMLMQSYMTKVRFNPRGNEVWMLKERAQVHP